MVPKLVEKKETRRASTHSNKNPYPLGYSNEGSSVSPTGMKRIKRLKDTLIGIPQSIQREGSSSGESVDAPLHYLPGRKNDKPPHNSSLKQAPISCQQGWPIDTLVYTSPKSIFAHINASTITRSRIPSFLPMQVFGDMLQYIKELSPPREREICQIQNLENHSLVSAPFTSSPFCRVA